MSLQMEFKADPRLIRDIQDFLKRELEARSNARRNTQGLSENALATFRTAFKSGGLGEVDDLISTINEQLQEANSAHGLREGCGLEHCADGTPAFLHILFVDFKSDITIFGLSISI